MCYDQLVVDFCPQVVKTTDYFAIISYIIWYINNLFTEI